MSTSIVALCLVATAGISGCYAPSGPLVGHGRLVAILPPTQAPGLDVHAPSGGTVRLLMGPLSAQNTLRAALVAALQGRGFQVQDPAQTDRQLAHLRRLGPARAGSVARGLGVDALLTVRIEAWDPQLLRAQSRMRLGLSAALYSAAGQRLWAARTRRQISHLRTYRLGQDWRNHVRAAVKRLLQQPE